MRYSPLILTPLPAKNIIPFPSPFRRGLGRGGKGLGVRFFDVSLFCHSPVFPIINIFYKGGILGNTAFAHLILAISLL
jgi:hypothetical protein